MKVLLGHRRPGKVVFNLPRFNRLELKSIQFVDTATLSLIIDSTFLSTRKNVGIVVLGNIKKETLECAVERRNAPIPFFQLNVFHL